MTAMIGLSDASERNARPIIETADGSERLPSRAILCLADGSERTVWSRQTPSRASPAATGGGGGGGGSGTPYAIQSMIALEPGMKRGMRPVLTTYDPNYLTQFRDKLAGSMNIRNVRIALEGAPQAAGSTWNWATNGNLTWLDQIAAETWFRSFIVESRAEATAGGVFDATWEAKSRYRLAKWMERHANNTMCVVTPGNEPDNPSSDGAWGAMAPGTDAERLDRYIRLCRWFREEMHTGPRSYAGISYTFPSPVALIGPAWAFCDLTAGSGVFLGADLLERNDGEILEYWDGYDGHFHEGAGTRLPDWNGTTETAPPTNMASMHNMALALANANAVRVAAGKPEIWLPYTSTESGVSSTEYVGTWTSATAMQAIRRVRIANTFGMLHRYGCSMWVAYAWKMSAKSVDYNMVDSAYNAREIWNTMLEISDMEQYSIDRFASGVIPVPNKTQNEFWRPSDFMVYVPRTSQPTGTYPAFGIAEYNRVTMNGTKITCTSGDNNRIHMPIYLTTIGRPFDLYCDVTVSGGATARLCAYGYDKLRMNAAVEDKTTSSRTLNVRFTPRQHGSARNLPDPAYVDFWMEHNGVGTAEFSNMKIIPA